MLCSCQGCLVQFLTSLHILELNVVSWVCSSQEILQVLVRVSVSRKFNKEEGRHGFTSALGPPGLRGVGGVNTPSPCCQSSVESDFVKSFNTRGTRIFFSIYHVTATSSPPGDWFESFSGCSSAIFRDRHCLELGMVIHQEALSATLAAPQPQPTSHVQEETKNMVMSSLCLFSLLSFLSLFPLAESGCKLLPELHGRRVGPSITLLRSLAHVPASALIISQSI